LAKITTHLLDGPERLCPSCNKPISDDYDDVALPLWSGSAPPLTLAAVWAFPIARLVIGSKTDRDFYPNCCSTSSNNAQPDMLMDRIARKSKAGAVYSSLSPVSRSPLFTTGWWWWWWWWCPPLRPPRFSGCD